MAVIDRRTFLGAAAAALPARASGGPRAKVLSIEVISRQPDLYHGWPTLARRRSGELLAVCSGGREAHVCPFGRVELMRSKDGGRTWTWPEVLMDTPIDDRDAGVLETPGGALLVTTFTSLAYEPILARAEQTAPGAKEAWPAERLDRWRAAHRRVDIWERRRLLGTWMLRSTDGGATWSAPYRVPVNSPHGPVALSSGRLIYPGVALWERDRRVGVAESADDGATWRWLAPIPARAGDDTRNYHELHAVEARDGRIVVHIRNHNEANHRETLQTESKDGGRTWSEPRAIGVWGLPSHLLRLRGGRLLMSYGYRREPFGNLVRVSEDHGETWSEPLALSADGVGGDLGYPSTVELDDGTLATLWYERMAESPRAVLRLARWRLEA